MASPYSTPSQGLGLSSTQSDYKIRRNNFYYDEAKVLYNNELYSNLLTFNSWVTAIAQQQPELLTELQQCHIHWLCGEAAVKLQDFHRSEWYYRKCLQLFKALLKTNPALKPKLQEDCGSSTDIKYKIYLCLVLCKKTQDALKWLETIPAKQRNVQINMAMGNLYKQTGMERAAITSYKEVLRVCPMALEALEQLMLLGCIEDDVQSIVRDKTSKYNANLDWYNTWIRGMAAVSAKDNSAGIKIFKGIRDQKKLTGCVPLLHSLGVANVNYGDYVGAIEAFKLALHFEPLNYRGMDLYAFVLWQEEMTSDLHRLMHRLNENNLAEAKSEPWIASSYYSLAVNQPSRAQTFALRGSNFLGSTNPEGIIAHGNVLLKMKRYQDAVERFREVMARNPERFEPHRGIVECYLATSRNREAMTVAIGALKAVGQSPRVFNLCATALKKDPSTLPKAKAYLDKALEADCSFLPAILNYADIYESEGKYNEGIQMLKNYIDLRVSPAKLHIRLANMLSHNGMDDNAADQYAIALKLDPSNKEARMGLERLDPGSSRGNEAPFEGRDEMDLEDDDEDEVKSKNANSTLPYSSESSVSGETANRFYVTPATISPDTNAPDSTENNLEYSDDSDTTVEDDDLELDDDPGTLVATPGGPPNANGDDSVESVRDTGPPVTPWQTTRTIR